MKAEERERDGKGFCDTERSVPASQPRKEGVGLRAQSSSGKCLEGWDFLAHSHEAKANSEHILHELEWEFEAKRMTYEGIPVK